MKSEQISNAKICPKTIGIEQQMTRSKHVAGGKRAADLNLTAGHLAWRENARQNTTTVAA
jgi:hypothetical protein